MSLLIDVRGIALPRTRSSRTATMGGSSSSNTAQIQALLDKVGAMGGGDVKLLTALAIKTRLISVREHNEAREAERIIDWLREGKSVAQVSDAGTPSVSDPGAVLVDAVRKAGLKVVPIPGANAAVAALSASGFTPRAAATDADISTSADAPSSTGTAAMSRNTWATDSRSLAPKPNRSASRVARCGMSYQSVNSNAPLSKK